ncbi:phage tail assembly chaperone [Anaerosinus massiliensis]|uniref:phage tail assembly chaperone n=1 Tax=Massilibacillus massiliensis TaxID=1806837 RepID=UPI000DA62C0E|nr:XkdN-like protein [Massilibacillus massiliensis]
MTETKKSLTLQEFLAENTVENITNEVKVSSRIPFDFKIKSMTGRERDNYRKACTKKDKGNIQFDENKFQRSVIIGQTVNPVFNDIGFMSKIGAAVPEDCLEKVLLAGEQEELFKQILKVSGFDVGMKDLVEKAKN